MLCCCVEQPRQCQHRAVVDDRPIDFVWICVVTDMNAVACFLMLFVVNVVDVGFHLELDPEMCLCLRCCLFGFVWHACHCCHILLTSRMIRCGHDLTVRKENACAQCCECRVSMHSVYALLPIGSLLCNVVRGSCEPKLDTNRERHSDRCMWLITSLIDRPDALISWHLLTKLENRG